LLLLLVFLLLLLPRVLLAIGFLLVSLFRVAAELLRGIALADPLLVRLRLHPLTALLRLPLLARGKFRGVVTASIIVFCLPASHRAAEEHGPLLFWFQGVVMLRYPARRFDIHLLRRADRSLLLAESHEAWLWNLHANLLGSSGVSFATRD